jgi:hypothetical protein
MSVDLAELKAEVPALPAPERQHSIARPKVAR